MLKKTTEVLVADEMIPVRRKLGNPGVVFTLWYVDPSEQHPLGHMRVEACIGDKDEGYRLVAEEMLTGISMILPAVLFSAHRRAREMNEPGSTGETHVCVVSPKESEKN